MYRIFFLFLALIVALVFVINQYPQDSQFFGAFYGAGFAFLFMIIAKICSIYYERMKTNYNGIAEMQQECVRFIYAIESNQREVNNLLNCFDIEKKQYNHWFFQPRKVYINKSIPLKISKVPFLQDVMNLFLEIESLNHMMNATKEANDTFRNDFKDKPIPAEAVECRQDLLKGTLAALDHMLDKTYNILGKSRALSKIDEARHWLVYLEKGNKYNKKEEIAFDEELQKMSLEIQEHLNEEKKKKD